MKLTIRLFSILALGGALVTGMVGCLKDKEFDDKEIQSVSGGSTNVVEIRLTATSTVNFLPLVFDAIDRDTTVNLIPVAVASGPVSQDVNVTLTQKNSLVDDYNAANGTSFKVPPSNMFSIANPNGVVTIPKGSSIGYLQLKFRPKAFQGEDWALGFEITAVDNPNIVISGNLKSGVVGLLVTNIYDGTYHATGFFQHPSSPRPIDRDEVLSTISARGVSKILGDLVGTNVNIRINADNTVTITPGSGTSGTSASVGNIDGDPVYNNRYDPATKTFWLKYGYPLPGPTRIITEKVVRK